MKKMGFMVPAALLLVAGCEEFEGTNGPNSGRFISDLPESVLEIAAPHQNLEAVVYREEDNCYWYQHVGPVETTLLPLRTSGGNPICTRPAA
ncbi:hypothetical protein DZK27_07560 [Rhodobacteraceae bacterium 63075]|nr:hypothetical protein DZK27_07560 [Rhodobacteraceae bacterium 63075]